MSSTVTTWVTLGPRNYLISKSFGIATSCVTCDRSTRSTCAAGGPCARARSKSARADSAPSAITSTDPSRRLRASPRSPRRVAWRHTHQRNPTPWTWPCTRKRMAATQALPLPALRGPPAVPPDVDRRDPRQHRHRDEHVLAEPQKERAPEPVGQPVVGERAEDTPQHAAGHRKDEAHLSLGREIARGGHHQLARERQNRRLDRHEHHDAGIPHSSEQV